MKIKFISNACCIVETNAGTQILTDPWIENGVFEGSWCHFHKLKTTINDLQNVDAIYVSHIHPDHYDDRFFKFPKLLLQQKNKNISKVEIKEALVFNRSLIMENFIIPNQLRFPMSRNILEKYYN